MTQIFKKRQRKNCYSSTKKLSSTIQQSVPNPTNSQKTYCFGEMRNMILGVGAILYGESRAWNTARHPKLCFTRRIFMRNEQQKMEAQWIIAEEGCRPSLRPPSSALNPKEQPLLISKWPRQRLSPLTKTTYMLWEIGTKAAAHLQQKQTWDSQVLFCTEGC